MVKVADVAPEILPPFIKGVIPFLHWYVSPVPVAATEKLTEVSEHTVCEIAGWEVIATAWLTVSIVFVDVTGTQGVRPEIITL